MTNTTNVPAGSRLEEDIKKFLFPMYRGTMSHCYGDGYFYHSLLEKYDMTSDQLDAALQVVRNRYRETIRAMEGRV